MTFKIIDNTTIQIDKYVVKILDLIGRVGSDANMITGIYNIQLFENNTKIYNNNVCLKITTRKINLDNNIVNIINNNDNFIKIFYYDNNYNILENDFLNFHKGTAVCFMIMEKIDDTFHKLCSNLEKENFHLSANMLNYFTYTIINSMNYLLKNGLCYFDLKPLNIGYKINNNKFTIKIIDIDSIAYTNSSTIKTVTQTYYTSPFYFKRHNNDTIYSFEESQFNVILFTIFQLIFNDNAFNACKDYYIDNIVFTNYFIDPYVNYSLDCSNLKTTIIAYINSLILDNYNLNYQDFVEKYGDNIKISDKNLQNYLINLFYFAYKFKHDFLFKDTSLFKVNKVTIDDAFNVGDSYNIGKEIISQLLTYINRRKLYFSISNPDNKTINIRTILKPTIIEDITIKFIYKINANKYVVRYIDNINGFASKYIMSLEQIDDETIKFIKTKKYFNNIIFDIKLDKINVLNTEWNNVYLILSKPLINEKKLYNNNSSLNKIIENISYIISDLIQNQYYYNLDINDIYIKHNKVQLINYAKLEKYDKTDISKRNNQLDNMFDLILSIITNNVNQSEDSSNPNDQIITNLINLNKFDKHKIDKLNYVIKNNTELCNILNKIYKDIYFPK